ncbi:D-aminoacyl-tRNA deacylase [Kiritimatiella glycovorans]|uniref:D-aminoacyl-tRNA deacylase n=1 Tax=Kiritimatiella glycovorans TaxID=1307763 RepID=A0A0G3EI68_9BACT|nr:D-aminoacyl-tRNA deacylase [Kiritimatiella glycovorans]AKJ64510.1 D-tyrosyl-tRNA(Tyr) deacylase [Kiritimatiella glycovorans]
MKLVIQRVLSAGVEVDGVRVAEIGRGALVLAGVGEGDTEADARHLALKTAKLRMFEDADGRMNESLDAVKGSCLVVSQFTLYGDCRKGNRPSFVGAADPERGRALYELYVRELESAGIPVSTGRFGALMRVELVNDGPVTLMLESCGRA